MSAIYSNRLRNSAACLALLASSAFCATPAGAQQVAANTIAAVAAQSAGEIETVVVTGTAFDPESAIGVRFDDPKLAIPWPIRDPLVSPRDLSHPSF